MTMKPKPSVMPSMCGMARRKPKLAADAVTMMTFGPGVRHKAAANRTNGPSNSRMKPLRHDMPSTRSRLPAKHASRHGARRRFCRNYLGGTHDKGEAIDGDKNYVPEIIRPRDYKAPEIRPLR